MRLVKIITIILVLTGIVFAQEQAIDQTEVLDVAAIKQKAMADAEFDFNLLNKSAWAFSPIVSAILINLTYTVRSLEWTWIPNTDYVFAGAILVPSACSFSLRVILPEVRKAILSSTGKEYQSAYRAIYKSEIKKRRLKYSLIGAALAIPFRPVWFCSDNRSGCGSSNLK